ncbi:MAG: AAA family ATPase [Vulcanimicrobiota bacterium]
MNIRDIENAFQPAIEVKDPKRFAGRKSYVQDAYRALLSEGTNIAVVGNRGIGKSSLARQIVSMASGHDDLLKKLSIDTDAQAPDFLATYFACGNSVRTLGDLLNSLLTDSDALGSWIYDIPSTKTIIEKYAPKFNAGFASLGGEKSTSTTSSKAIQQHDVESVFTNVVRALVQECVATDGLIIVVDEFDQIKDPTGFASFLKSLATNVPKVRFCIVGVAQDIQQLMKEHASADRLFSGSVLTLPPMNPEELTEIIEIAESSIKGSIVFDESARRTLVKLAQGHPYMIHLIGKDALKQAFLKKDETITQADIESALRGIAERGTDPVLEGRYKKAVASSQHREIVLRAMANSVSGDDGEIQTTAAYQQALTEGVENSSQYVGHLTTEQFGEELVKVRERYYRFRDSLFRTYVTLRPPIF